MERFVIKVVIVVVLYIGCVATFLYYCGGNREYVMTSAEEDRWRCIAEHYKLTNGTVIYNYPDNPYVYWKGNKVYLTGGNCE